MTLRSIGIACLLATFVSLPALTGSAAPVWTGCYAGLHAGAMQGVVDHKVTGFPVHPSYQNDVRFRNATAGAHAGCNYQNGSFILGVEGDLNRTSIDRSTIAFSNEDTQRLQLWRDRLDWFGTLRARMGVANGNWHAYATGGLALSDLKLGFEDYRSASLQAEFIGKTSRGWAAGGGLEYMLHSQWFARFEYLYYRFDSRLILIDGGNTFFRGDKPHFHALRFGITRRFGD